MYFEIIHEQNKKYTGTGTFFGFGYGKIIKEKNNFCSGQYHLVLRTTVDDMVRTIGSPSGSTLTPTLWQQTRG